MRTIQANFLILLALVRRAKEDAAKGTLEVASLDDAIRFGVDIKKRLESVKEEGWMPKRRVNDTINLVNVGIATLRGVRKTFLARN